jgi:hypothetical protein
MTITTKDIYKIDWFTWDEKDLLIIQSRALNVDEEEVEEDGRDGYMHLMTKLIRIDFMGSVKFRFNGINTQEKVDSVIKDIYDGKIK